MPDEIMILTRTGEIQQQLQDLRSKIEIQTRMALELECNEDTYKEVKKVKAELNNEFKAVEEQRKAIKKAFMAPYDEFEAIYKANVTDVFKPAEQALAKKISDVENGLKQSKTLEITEFFDECCKAHDIQGYTLADAGIKVGLTESKKKLKEQAEAWITGVTRDLEFIATQDNSSRILGEYNKCFNLAQAIQIVKAQMEHEAQVARILEERKKAAEIKQATVEKVEEVLTPPVEDNAVEFDEVPEEKIYEMTFKVKGTLNQLKAIKDFMTKEGIDYE